MKKTIDTRLHDLFINLSLKWKENFLVSVWLIMNTGCTTTAVNEFPYSTAAHLPDNQVGILYFNRKGYDEAKIYRISRRENNAERDEYFETKGEPFETIKLSPGNYIVYYDGGAWENELELSVEAGRLYEIKQTEGILCGSERELDFPSFFDCYTKGSIWIEDTKSKQILTTIGNYCFLHHNVRTVGNIPLYKIYHLISCDRSDVQLSLLKVSNPRTVRVSRITRYEKTNQDINLYTEYTKHNKYYRTPYTFGKEALKKYQSEKKTFVWEEFVPGKYLIKYSIRTRTGTKLWEGAFDAVFKENHHYEIESKIEGSVPEKPFQYKISTWIEDITEEKKVTEIQSHCCTYLPMHDQVKEPK